MKLSAPNVFGFALLLLAAAACTPASRKDAMELYRQSEAAIAQQRYAHAIELLDTLNERCYNEVEIRRQALGLRARAMEGLATDSITIVDGQLAEATLAEDSLRRLFRHVEAPAPGLDGFWLPEGVNERAMATTGIQARVSDDGYLYIVAAVNGRRIGLKAIELKAGDASVRSSDIARSRLVTVGSSESASFNQEEVADFGPWIQAHPTANKIVFIGSRGNMQVTLTAATRNEIRLCAELATATQNKRLAAIRREKYERMLRAARDQVANYATRPE